MTNDKANLQRKRKYSRLRAYSLIAVYVLMGIHIAHWKIAGQTLAPLELNEVLYTLHLGIITAGFIFMGITMIGTIFFGRFFCSWACHILALQDFSVWILGKLKFRPPNIRSRAFLFVPVVAMLYMFAWPQAERLISGGDFAGFRILSDSQGWASFMTKDFWRNLPGIPITLFTFFICGFAIIYLLGSRSFCQKVCPYGVIFSIADKFAPGKIKLTGDCQQCGTCTAHCTSHILVHREIARFGKVVNSDCLKDLDCVSVCPSNAISYGFTKPSFLDSFRRLKDDNIGYSFSFAEDAGLAFFTFIYVVIFRGLYDLVPFLLAITLAVIFAYFTIVFIRVVRQDFVLFGKYVLKRNGKQTVAGRSFSAMVLLIMVFSAHSGFVHYHQYKGDQFYLAATMAGGDSWGSAANGEVERNLKAALPHLEKSARWGIYSPLSLNRQLAAVFLFTKDYEKGEKYLSKMLLEVPEDHEARLRLAKLFFVSGRERECMDALKIIIDADTAEFSAHDNHIRGEALLTLGHIEEKNGFASSALEYYKRAQVADIANQEVLLALGVLYMQAGKLELAEKYLHSFSVSNPGSPLAHNNLSLIYLRTNRNDLAVHHLLKLVELQPGNSLAHYNLGMLYYRSGNNSWAVSELEKTLQLDPAHLNAHIGLANALERSGDHAGAEQHRNIADELKTVANEKND